MIEKMLSENNVKYHSINGKEDINNYKVLETWLNEIKNFIKPLDN